LRYFPSPLAGPRLFEISRPTCGAAQTDDTGFAKLFCTVDGPGSFEPLAKYLLILLEPGWGQKVFAVECEFEAKEIKDGFDQSRRSLAGRDPEVRGHLTIEWGALRDLIDVLVFNPQQGALFEIRQDNAPTAAKIAYGPIEEK
jgi:hypothetical protein